VPDSGKTNQLFFDAGPNHPGDFTDGLFGVIHAAGDQGGNGGGTIAPTGPVASNLFLGQDLPNISGTPPQSPPSQLTTTGDGGTARTTDDHSVSTADSNEAFDISLLGWPQATAQPADFFAALSTVMKKVSATSETITQNFK
jgi:hypothetical protein